MTEIFATGSDFMTLTDFGLETSRGLADRPRMVVVVSTTSESLPEARQRVHKADATERRRLAETFVERLRGAADVKEVWLRQTHPSLEVSVVLSTVTLPRELELRAQFAELTSKHDAELKIYRDERAAYARKGERLLG